jgi:long-chain acyl-CoA synthetase
MESLVLDHDGRIEAIVYPDLDKADAHGIDEKTLESIMEQNRATLNGMIPKYAAVAKIGLTFEEFEKTATKKIKRRLYSVG